MIDTDKYEGHAEGPWKIKSYNRGQAFTGINFNMTLTEKLSFTMKNGREKEKEATANLIADAPLLLAEVERLRKQLVAYMDFLNWVAEEHNNVWDEYEGKDEL
jgi:hypothetical protein